jgi:hypothetical protein
MRVSILHVGLPLNHPTIPIEERPKVTRRLAEIQQTMKDAGYDYEIFCISPESGLEDFRSQLKMRSVHGVLIGGGVASQPAMTYFMEQIVDVTHEVAPHVKIMFYNHAVTVRATVERWFPSPSINGSVR